MTPHISKALQRLFPEATPGVDFLLQDDGDGPYIREWNLAAPKPSQAKIDALGGEIEKEIMISSYTAEMQKRLDDFARTRNYDGILSAATYATSSVPKFAAEGQYAVEARDATWAKGYEILAAVEAGTRAAPTLDELAAELPALAWPQ